MRIAAPFLVLLFGAVATVSPAAPADRPNILFIVADDLGIRDSSVYGSDFYETPNMERLAESGVVFEDAYSANPLCTPTRASLITGLYPERIPMTAAGGHLAPKKDFAPINARAHPSIPVIVPNSRHALPHETVTLAERLGPVGYRTAFFGKWHLGGSPAFWPDHHGFDVNVGGTGFPGPPSYFSPYRNPLIDDGPEGEHIADRLAEEAVRFMGEGDGRPFFACLWFFDVHSPYQADPEAVGEWTEKARSADPRRSATMGAMVSALDRALGRVLDYLEESGEAENTLVVFTSDNGGNMYDIIDWAVTPTDNAPFRGGKGNIYEGGIRVPAIVRWPGRFPAGERSAVPIHSFDWYPTFLEASGFSLVGLDQTLDGVSLLPYLAAGVAPRRELLFWHFPHNVAATANRAATAVRSGDWKLIRFYFEGEGGGPAFELYNLAEDPGETRDLADVYPEKVAALDAAISRHLEETGAAVPRLNPAYDPGFENPWEHWSKLGAGERRGATGSVELDVPAGEPLGLGRRFHTRLSDQLFAEFTLATDARGEGAVGYNRFNNPEEQVAFDLAETDAAQAYRVPLPADTKIRSLQIIAGEGPGWMRLSDVRLVDAEGNLWWSDEWVISGSRRED